MKILFKNATVVTMNKKREILTGDVLVENNRIKKIGRLRKNADKIIDAKGKILLPGFVQIHTHLCQTLLRNCAEDMALLDWLKKKVWPGEALHTKESLYYSALLGSAELIGCGTTTILDMGTVNHTDSIFEAAKKIGLRMFCGKVMMDEKSRSIPKGLQENTSESMAQSVALYEKWHGAEGGRLQYAFAPRFVVSCTEKLMMEIRNFAFEKDLIVHSHSSENEKEMEFVKKKTGCRNLEYFDKLGLTGKKLILAHCIWLDDAEIKILKKTGTNVAHCPSSNLKLGSGIADIPKMLKSRINVGIGADGAPCNNNLDIFMEMRLAGLIQKPRKGPKAMPGKRLIEMATINGAKALNMDREIGSIEIGKKADLIMLNTQKVHSVPFEEENIYSGIVYSCSRENVEMVVADGKILKENGQLKTIRTKEVIKRSNRCTKQLRSKIS